MCIGFAVHTCVLFYLLCCSSSLTSSSCKPFTTNVTSSRKAADDDISHELVIQILLTTRRRHRKEFLIVQLERFSEIICKKRIKVFHLLKKIFGISCILIVALAIRTADRMNNSVAIRTADCAAITRRRLFSHFCHTRINVCSN